MTSLCGTNSPNDAFLSQNPYPSLDRPHLYTQNLRQFTRRHKWIRLHVPNHLQGQCIEIIAAYTDRGVFFFVFYTDTTFGYLKTIVSFLSIFQDIGNALLEKPLQNRQSFARKVIMRMDMEPKTAQSFNRHQEARIQPTWEAEPMIKQHRMLASQIGL